VPAAGWDDYGREYTALDAVDPRHRALLAFYFKSADPVVRNRNMAAMPGKGRA
jgi:hypothetical protein